LTDRANNRRLHQIYIKWQLPLLLLLLLLRPFTDGIKAKGGAEQRRSIGLYSDDRWHLHR